MTEPLRFAVIGDTHYVQPDSHRQAFGGQPRGVTELVDLRRNLWMTEHILPAAISAIRSVRPDFVVHTGDVIQGHCDDEAAGLREMEEALELFQGLEVPIFFAPASHDGVPSRTAELPVRQRLLGAVAAQLGLAESEPRGYYSFERGGSLFVVLDYMTFREGEAQARFLEAELAKGPAFEHVFLFAHQPLIPVGRPFFSNHTFVRCILDMLARYSVDAYFCGHTHNQIVSLHRLGSGWLPHFKGTVLAYPNEPPVPLEAVRPLLPDPSTYELGWGYLEDSAPGWFLVTVDGSRVHVAWHVLGAGLQGEVAWERGKKPQFQRLPSLNVPAVAVPPAPGRVRSARLRAAGSGCRSQEAYEVTLNGHRVGRLPQLEYFDCRQFLPLDPAFLSWQAPNALQITTAAEPMCIGALVIEVETDDGWIRTDFSPYFTNTDRWDAWQVQALNYLNPASDLRVELTFVPGELERSPLHEQAAIGE